MRQATARGRCARRRRAGATWRRERETGDGASVYEGKREGRTLKREVVVAGGRSLAGTVASRGRVRPSGALRPAGAAPRVFPCAPWGGRRRPHAFVACGRRAEQQKAVRLRPAVGCPCTPLRGRCDGRRLDAWRSAAQATYARARQSQGEASTPRRSARRCRTCAALRRQRLPLTIRAQRRCDARSLVHVTPGGLRQGMPSSIGTMRCLTDLGVTPTLAPTARATLAQRASRAGGDSHAWTTVDIVGDRGIGVRQRTPAHARAGMGRLHRRVHRATGERLWLLRVRDQEVVHAVVLDL